MYCQNRQNIRLVHTRRCWLSNRILCNPSNWWGNEMVIEYNGWSDEPKLYRMHTIICNCWQFVSHSSLSRFFLINAESIVEQFRHDKLKFALFCCKNKSQLYLLQLFQVYSHFLYMTVCMKLTGFVGQFLPSLIVASFTIRFYQLLIFFMPQNGFSQLHWALSLKQWQCNSDGYYMACFAACLCFHGYAA